MKKIILFLILTIFLSGCSLCNLNNFVLPDDIDFISCIQELKTPKIICNYMEDNFTCKENIFYNPDPYELWLNPEGDCNDFASFASFSANFHNYPTYQIRIHFKGTFINHVLCIFLENGKYTYSSNLKYFPIYVSNFSDIVLDYFEYDQREITYYEIFDYDMNLIPQVTSL